MSATEWKFVPVEPTAEMREAINGLLSAYDDGSDITPSFFMKMLINSAPVPPSVESLLENWTPSDQKAFARFRDEHFPGEMSSYAIQSLGSAWKGGQANAQPQPVAHLTIPGALEWDGDNGTHGVVGTHGAYGESLANHSGDTNEKAAPAVDRQSAPVMKLEAERLWGKDGEYAFTVADHAWLDRCRKEGGTFNLYAEQSEPVSAYTAVDMTTAAAGGFRDGLVAFSEDGKRNVLAEVFFQKGDEPFICAVRGRICVEQLEAAQRDFRENLPDELEQGDGIYTFDFFYEKGQYDDFGRCEIAPGWGFDFVSYAAFEAADDPVIEPEAFDDIPDFTPGSGNKSKRRIAAMEKAKSGDQ